MVYLVLHLCKLCVSIYVKHLGVMELARHGCCPRIRAHLAMAFLRQGKVAFTGPNPVSHIIIYWYKYRLASGVRSGYGVGYRPERSLKDPLVHISILLFFGPKQFLK